MGNSTLRTVGSTAASSQSSKLVTATCAFHPILGCLGKVEEFLGQGRDRWIAQGALQTQALRLAGLAGADLALFTEKEFQSRVSQAVEEINHFLAENGFSIKLEKIQDALAFYVASILKVGVDWLNVGEKAVIWNNKKSFPGVEMKHTPVFNSPHLPNPIARIDTKSGDRVWLSVADKQLEGLDLLERLAGVTADLNSLSSCEQHSGVNFPMVTYDEMVDISWLVGMKIVPPGSNGWEIAEALQQTKFRMNERGAKVESAVAMSMRACSMSLGPRPLLIDQPFYLWMTRDGLKVPYFGALFAESHWSDPGSID